MDAAELGRAEAELVAWGLLGRTEAGPVWTRRFRGAIMRQAARMAEAERAGSRPEGHPLETTVRAALAEWDIPEGAASTRVHERLLVAIELAQLPAAVRDALGAVHRRE